MVRKFEFNTIYIVESLKETDLQTGTILYNDLLKWVPYKIDFLKCNIFQISSKLELFIELEKVKFDVVNSGRYPFIHFEIHGSQLGLVLNSGELVTWLELVNRLREINILLKNNLFISLATCYGAHIYGEVKPFLPSPFFAFIGSWEQISQGDVMISFYNFFETMLTTSNLPTINFQEAVKKLNETKEQIEYGFYNSEQIFDRAMEDYDKNLTDVKVTNERIEYLVNEARKNDAVKRTPIEITRKQVKFLLIDQNELTKAYYKKQFLMLP